MDRLHLMQVFVAVADSAGLAPAARKLQLSPPAVTRAIAALEERLGLLLFHRTTRRVRVTKAGERYLEDCRRILAEIDEAEAAAAGAHGEPRGRIAVTASIRFGRLYVTPLLVEFLARYPEISAQTLFVDRVVDLLDEGLDVAIRIGKLPDSSLTAIRVGSVRQVVCAAPEYLERHGVPLKPQDLQTHEIVLFSGLSPRPHWRFPGPEGDIDVSLHSRLAVNTADVAIAAALSEYGLTRVLSYMIAPELNSGRLKRVLAEYEPEPLPIHVIYQEGRKAAGRVRAFVDFAVGRLRGDGSIN
jgi:DNA-binding transcriptional LysR family regulator